MSYRNTRPHSTWSEKMGNSVVMPDISEAGTETFQWECFFNSETFLISSIAVHMLRGPIFLKGYKLKNFLGYLGLHFLPMLVSYCGPCSKHCKGQFKNCSIEQRIGLQETKWSCITCIIIMHCRWQELIRLTDERKRMLKGAEQVHRFVRDASETNDRMNEKVRQ